MHHARIETAQVHFARIAKLLCLKFTIPRPRKLRTLRYPPIHIVHATINTRTLQKEIVKYLVKVINDRGGSPE